MVWNLKLEGVLEALQGKGSEIEGGLEEVLGQLAKTLKKNGVAMKERTEVGKGEMLLKEAER